MTKQSAVRDVLSTSEPTTPTRTLARILCKRFPTLFPTPEAARGPIRYHRGQDGTRNRAKLADRSLVRPAGSQADRPTEKQAEAAAAPDTLEDQLLRRLARNLKQKKGATLIELADGLDRSPKAIREAIDTLRARGYNLTVNPDDGLELSTTIPKAPPVAIDTKDYFGDDWIRFGFVADTHLASKYERLDVLNALYDIYEREGIRTVYHGGNWIDGEAPFNRYEVHCIGFENQLAYFLKNYPQRPGIVTQLVSGDDHEGWFVRNAQVNVGKTMQDRAREAGRQDLVDLGYMERDLVFKSGKGASTVRVIHAGGGSAYATSYTSQKYVETLQGGEKPAMVLVGHYHKFDHSYPREVHVIQGGCTMDQSPFMRKKRLQAMVGGCLVEIKQAARGHFARVRVEWIPFYDKKFYTYKWN